MVPVNVKFALVCSLVYPYKLGTNEPGSSTCHLSVLSLI